MTQGYQPSAPQASPACERQFGHTDREYKALSWRVMAAKFRAECAHVAEHKSDYGACGFAYIVVTDKTAARYLAKFSRVFHKRPGGTAEMMVACRNWQSLTAAERVAQAMADEFNRSGIAASIYGRMD